MYTLEGAVRTEDDLKKNWRDLKSAVLNVVRDQICGRREIIYKRAIAVSLCVAEERPKLSGDDQLRRNVTTAARI